MQILVTGHNGYIGAVLVPFLTSIGDQVVGLDSYFYEDCALNDQFEQVPAIRKDLRDITISDLAQFEAVVHLGGLSNDPLGDLKPEWTYDINCNGSINLAKLSKEAGVSRFIFSSSCSMYGAAVDELLTEEASLNPLTPYACSKVRAEEEISRLADSSFSPIFLRNATAYGVSPKLRVDLVLNNLVGWAFTTGKIRILSDGLSWRPIVHVQDIAQAIALVITAPRHLVHNQAFNVGVNGENYQVRDLALIVQDTVPGSSLEFAPRGGSDPRNYKVDFSKLQNTFPEFHPKWNAHLGAQQLFEAYKQHGLNLDEFQDRKYIRLNQLKYLLGRDCLDESLRWKIAQVKPLDIR